MSQSLAVPDSFAVRSGARPPPFTCTWKSEDDEVAWLHLAGGLDLAAIPQLKRALGERRLRAWLVVLDLRGLASTDSAGARAIVEAAGRARRAGRRLIALRGPADVDRVFDLTPTDGEVEMFDLDPGCPAVLVLLDLPSPSAVQG
jgi:anti-anti-sigma factor